MIWQDITLSICAFVFSLALVPQVIRGFKEKKGHVVYSTSIPTFLGLYVTSFVMFTLSLYYSSIMNFTAGTLWLIIFLQKAIYK